MPEIKRSRAGGLLDTQLSLVRAVRATFATFAVAAAAYGGGDKRLNRLRRKVFSSMPPYRYYKHRITFSMVGPIAYYTLYDKMCQLAGACRVE